MNNVPTEITKKIADTKTCIRKLININSNFLSEPDKTALCVMLEKLNDISWNIETSQDNI